MIRFKQHIKLLIIEKSKSLGEAINKINLNKMKTIFVVNDIDKKYIGSVTDGDLRRGIVRNLSKKDNIMTIVNKKSIFLSKKPILFCISLAALLVKVTASISFGNAKFFSTIFAILDVRTFVLPEPAPATINSGPDVCKTASF